MPPEKLTPIRRQILDLIEQRLAEQKQEIAALRQRIEAQDQLITDQAAALQILQRGQDAIGTDITRLTASLMSLNSTLNGLRVLADSKPSSGL